MRSICNAAVLGSIPLDATKKLTNLFNINQYLSSNFNKSWKPLAKGGAVLIGIGLLIFILKELIIGILSAIFIGLGVYFFVIAFNLWNSNRLY